VLQGHRPENAGGRREPAAAATAPATQAKAIQAKTTLPWPTFRRPSWLLQQPEQLEVVEGVPRRRGSLRFCGAVERIETGWWDGGDVGRDYYTVYDIYGVQLWIFRERTEPHRWFLHGVFG
jgi:protein ImuB